MMTTPISFSFSKFLLSNSLFLVLILLSLKKGYALERREAAEGYYHTIHVSSLIPSSSCKPSAQGHSPLKLPLSRKYYLICMFAGLNTNLLIKAFENDAIQYP